MKRTLLSCFFVAISAAPAAAQLTFIPPARPSAPPMPLERRADPRPVETPVQTPTLQAPQFASPRAPASPPTATASPEPAQSYSAPTDTRAANGFGENIPLSVALMQIVPSPWRIDLPREQAMTPVTWRGGDAWPKTAEATIRSAGLEPVWQTGVLFVRAPGSEPPRRGPDTPATMPAAAQSASASPPVGISAGPSAASAANVSASAARRSWQAAQGTYQETLRNWAGEAGWNVFFFDPDIDYAIEVPATFSGDFQNAVRSLTRAFRNVSRPPSVTFHCDTKTPECSTQTVVVRSAGSREN
ncbi:MAG: TcpQ domain-containing protein [Azospirillum sp.]|nr:TcpQ domain-containing protein [Azospirillum sp.]